MNSTDPAQIANCVANNSLLTAKQKAIAQNNMLKEKKEIKAELPGKEIKCRSKKRLYL